MECKHIQFCWAECEAVVKHKAMEAVVVCVPSGQVRRKARVDLIIWRIVLLVRVAVEHRLPVAYSVIDFCAQKIVVVRNRNRGGGADPGNGGDLRDEIRWNEQVLPFAEA